MPCRTSGGNTFQTLQPQLELPTELSAISFEGYNDNFKKFSHSHMYEGKQESQKVIRKLKKV